MKFRRSKTFAPLFAFLWLSGLLYAGIWDYKSTYQKSIIATALHEGEVAFPAKKTEVRALYSLVGNLNTVWDGGPVALHLHIQKNEKGFRGPVRIFLTSAGAGPSKYELARPNYPVSVPESLVYSFPFEYRLGEKLRVRVVSPEKAFPEFELELAYPRRRF